MCEYCDCQAIAAIALLTAEHDRALDHIRAASQALHADDDRGVRASCARLREILGPHTEVEEQALFPALHQDFPDQIAALLGEHAAVEQALDEATLQERADGWQLRLETALELLREHILKEQDGVFPAALSTLSGVQWDRLEQVRGSAAQTATSAAQVGR